MLESLRAAVGTWVAKVLLLLLILSFAVWGISGQMGGGAGTTVVTAGDTTVSVTEYRLAYDRQVAVLSQRFGTRITREQAQALGVDGQVLAQLVAGAVLDEQARTMGLGLSRDRLAALTAEDPAFQGVGGRFDRSQFEFVLRQIGMRPEDYLRNREQVAIRQQIVEAVSDGIAIPDTFLHAMALYEGEDRTVEYVVIPASAVAEVETPSDDVLSVWFTANQRRYEAPEYRSIAYVKLEPADIADPASITDEQVEEDYRARIASYTTPERRMIEQIVFSGAEAAQLAVDRISGGATFEEVVAAEGRTMEDVRIGNLERARVPDQAVAEAAFALRENEVSGIVEGAFGPALVRVTEITPEQVRPLSQVAGEIRSQLAMAEASRILFDVHDRYEDARAAGESMEEAAQALGLGVVTVEAVDRTARAPDGTVIADLPQSAALLREAFETEPGVENAPINIGTNGFVFYEVLDVTPRRDRTLDEVRDSVVADWTAEEISTRLATLASETEQRLRDGASLDTIAEELGLEKQTKRGLRRGADDPELGSGAVDAVFAVAEGGVGAVATQGGDGQILFQVTEVFEPAGASAETIDPAQREALGTGLADDLLDQLVARLQGVYGVTVNQGAIQQALSF